MKTYKRYIRSFILTWPDRMLNWSHHFVWPRGFALARSLVALGTAVTFLATPMSTLFYQSENFPEGTVCSSSIVNTIAIFCRINPSYYNILKPVLIAILLIIIIGFAPRFLGILHWYITFSFVNASPVPDGGDHLALVITTLILPASLFDSRRWAWRSEPQLPASWWIIAGTTQLAGILQVMFVYLYSSIAKFGVTEWADGTALWYWSRQSIFGFPDHLRIVTDEIFSVGLAVASLTYSVLLLELFLGMSILMTWRWKALAFILGVVFHLCIALFLGLVSFALSAWGLLVLAYSYTFRRLILYTKLRYNIESLVVILTRTIDSGRWRRRTKESNSKFVSAVCSDD